MPSSSDDHPLAPAPGSFPRVVEQRLPTASVTSVSGIMRDIGNGSVTVVAEAIRHNTDEAMVWQATPSLVLLFGPAVKYLLVVIAVALGCSYLHDQLDVAMAARASATETPGVGEAKPAPHRPSHAARVAAAISAKQAPSLTGQQAQQYADGLRLAPWCVAGLAVLMLLGRLVALKTTRYSASSQRLIHESGILRTVNLPFELHLLGNAIISKPLLLRPFGVAHLLIPSHRITLRGLRNADYVRDILRNAGQNEAQRMDKIRWR